VDLVIIWTIIAVSGLILQAIAVRSAWSDYRSVSTIEATEPIVWLARSHLIAYLLRLAIIVLNVAVGILAFLPVSKVGFGVFVAIVLILNEANQVAATYREQRLRRRIAYRRGHDLPSTQWSKGE